MIKYKNLLRKSQTEELQKRIYNVLNACTDAGGAVSIESLRDLNVEDFLALMVLNNINSSFKFIKSEDR